MRFENNNQIKFLGKWQYAAQLTFAPPKRITSPTGEEYDKWRSIANKDVVESIETYLSHRAEGEWDRKGNMIYINTLGDAFLLRLFFNDHIEVIRKSTSL